MAPRRNAKGQFIKGSGRKMTKRNPAPPASLMVVNPAKARKRGGKTTPRDPFTGRYLKMNPATGRPSGSIADAFMAAAPGAAGGALSFGVGFGIDKAKWGYKGKAAAELVLGGLGGIGLSAAGFPHLGAGFAGGGMRGTLERVRGGRAAEAVEAPADDTEGLGGWGALVAAPGNMGLTPAELRVLVNAPVAGVGSLVEAPANMNEGMAGLGDDDDDTEAQLMGFGDDDDGDDPFAGLGDDDDDGDPFDGFGADDDEEDDPFS